ncbi:MAG TPA: hypothetical protein VEW46_19470 [Pyrinomonadaceae bacterium]|nr:hypothetical protein [Pyrinomonadaceae bacterium]
MLLSPKWQTTLKKDASRIARLILINDSINRLAGVGFPVRKEILVPGTDDELQVLEFPSMYDVTFSVIAQRA